MRRSLHQPSGLRLEQHSKFLPLRTHCEVKPSQILPLTLPGCLSTSRIYLCTCPISGECLCMFLLLSCKCSYLFSFVTVPFSCLRILFPPLDFTLLRGRAYIFYFTLIPRVLSKQILTGALGLPSVPLQTDEPLPAPGVRRKLAAWHCYF